MGREPQGKYCLRLGGGVCLSTIPLDPVLKNINTFEINIKIRPLENEP